MASNTVPANDGVAPRAWSGNLRRDRAALATALVAIALAACGRSSPRPTAPPATQLQDAIAALGATRVCDRLHDAMIGLADRSRGTATGTLWVRSCDVASNRGRTTVTIAAQGWQVMPTGPDEAREVERFDVALVATGWIGVRLDPATRTAAFAFVSGPGSALRVTPGAPGVVLPEAAEVALRAQVLGALVGALAAPGREPPLPAAGADVLVHGLDATFALHARRWSFTVPGIGPAADLGRPMPDELGPGGLAVSGPFTGPSVTIRLAPHDPALRVELACAVDAAALAAAYLQKRSLPQITPLISAAPRATSLRIDRPTCPVALVVRASRAAAGDVRIGWTRDRRAGRRGRMRAAPPAE